MPALTADELGGMRGTVEATMTDRAVVDLPAAAGTDPYRNRIDGEPTVTHVDLPCQFWTATGREIVGPDVLAVAGEHLMKVPVATEITERHRVVSVENFLGESLASNLNIRMVITRPTHKLLRFDEVK